MKFNRQSNKDRALEYITNKECNNKDKVVKVIKHSKYSSVYCQYLISDDPDAFRDSIDYNGRFLKEAKKRGLNVAFLDATIDTADIEYYLNGLEQEISDLLGGIRTRLHEHITEVVVQDYHKGVEIAHGILESEILREWIKEVQQTGKFKEVLEEADVYDHVQMQEGKDLIERKSKDSSIDDEEDNNSIPHDCMLNKEDLAPDLSSTGYSSVDEMEELEDDPSLSKVEKLDIIVKEYIQNKRAELFEQDVQEIESSLSSAENIFDCLDLCNNAAILYANYLSNKFFNSITIKATDDFYETERLTEIRAGLKDHGDVETMGLQYIKHEILSPLDVEIGGIDGTPFYQMDKGVIMFGIYEKEDGERAGYLPTYVMENVDGSTALLCDMYELSKQVSNEKELINNVMDDIKSFAGVAGFDNVAVSTGYSELDTIEGEGMLIKFPAKGYRNITPLLFDNMIVLEGEWAYLK